MRFLSVAMFAIAVPAITTIALFMWLRWDLVLAGFLGGLIGIVVADEWSSMEGRGK